jgi:hypothetical protein
MNKFAKFALASFGILALAGCETPEEWQERHDTAILKVNQNLPDGCKLSYAGSVPSDSAYNTNIFYVRCNSANTVTTNTQTTVPSGKSTINLNGTVFDLVPAETPTPSKD